MQFYRNISEINGIIQTIQALEYLNPNLNPKEIGKVDEYLIKYPEKVRRMGKKQF